MSATAKQRSVVNAAARELWQIAESGDAGDLDHVLARGVNINARNRHGTTALMKAAAHGHAGIVRALLEHGADPNLARHDRFNALALAAFFGHTETVEILIEHGARTDMITRCGASAQTWAARRTFDETARCLESSAPVSAPPTKLLKDPPEIWDLVQEVPRGGFNPGSAFVSRLKSMRANVGLRLAAVLVVSIASIVGVLFFRGSQAGSFPDEGEANENAVVSEEVTTPPQVSETKSEPASEPATREVGEVSHHSESPTVVNKPSRRVVVGRQTKARAARREEPEESGPVVKVSDATPVAAKPRIEPRSPSVPVNAGLSPQLITPARSAAKKAKVIQWP